MIERLEVRGFRNLEPTVLELGEGTHLVLGPNGAGKTSLLEAVYLLATTRSFRTARLQECVRHGEEGFWLHGRTGERVDLESHFHSGERRRAVNGNRVPLADYLAVQPVVAWTPGELDVLVGPPAARRRFLDRGLVARKPALLSTLARYRRALQEKRGLLQEKESDGRRTMAERVDLVMSWNGVLAEAASTLIAERDGYVKSLRLSLAEILDTCELKLPSIELCYLPSPTQGLDGAEAILDQLESSVEREIQARQPLYGPHRDDLQILWDAHPIRGVASAGERKALGLALTAAHGRLLEENGLVPTYLLDDVDTELDSRRLAALWRHFGRAGQLLATSNRPAVWADLEIARRIRCESGGLFLEGPEDEL